MARISKGRRKIVMEKIKKKSNLQVTFSKRKSGVFKKASELSVLCGAEVALIVPSPGNKVHSFGNPNVECIIDRYMKNDPPTFGVWRHVTEARSNARLLTNELNQLEDNLKLEERIHYALVGIRNSSIEEGNHWWEAPIAEMNLEQLEHLMIAMKKLKNVDEKRMILAAINGTAFPPAPQVYH